MKRKEISTDAGKLLKELPKTTGIDCGQQHGTVRKEGLSPLCPSPSAPVGYCFGDILNRNKLPYLHTK